MSRQLTEVIATDVSNCNRWPVGVGVSPLAQNDGPRGRWCAPKTLWIRGARPPPFWMESACQARFREDVRDSRCRSLAEYRRGILVRARSWAVLDRRLRREPSEQPRTSEIVPFGLRYGTVFDEFCEQIECFPY